MVSTSGAELLPHNAIRELLIHLLPQATLITPNIPEANLLLSQTGLSTHDVRSVTDFEDMGRMIQSLGPKWVLIKGGHVPFKADLTVPDDSRENYVVVNVLVGPEGQMVQLQTPWQESTSTHGTGCSLACKLTPFPVDQP